MHRSFDLTRVCQFNEFYHAGVLRFSFGCISSPAYLSELYEYLYVGGK
jgi:hypothetical protein